MNHAHTTRLAIALALIAPVTLYAQHEHATSTSDVTAAPPAQAAYAAIGAMVRLLTADPNTDWSRVNIEALRQHLIDMDDVTLRSVVSQQNVPGGMVVDVTGVGRVTAAIQRMVTDHAAMLDAEAEYRATVAQLPNGVRLSVTAKRDDPRLVDRIRGLGFAGLLTVGEHHASHHIALARGEAHAHGK